MILTKETIKAEEKRLKFSYFKAPLLTKDRDIIVSEINNYIFAINNLVAEISLPELPLSVSDKKLVQEMKNSVRVLRKFVRLHCAKSYKEWLNSKERAIKMKMACGYDRRLKSLIRPYGYMDVFTLEDPVTDDELEYALGFAKDVYPEKNYKKIEDVEINVIRGAIQCLMTN